MVCPHCLTPNPAGTTACSQCSTAMPEESETVVISGPESWSEPLPSALSAMQKPLRPGNVLGYRYEIVSLLGKGGMGAVYKARDRELDRMVALKIIRPDLAGNADMMNRFKQELILARQITHRNVIRIYDLGVADGRRFISMEYVEGQDLAHILKERHKIPPREAAGIMRQICDGLAAAHAEEVVHRDLKPQNVMLDPEGKVSIMDFGIARSVQVNEVRTTSEVIGTPVYMSPEQGRGDNVDARSDLFTVGIIFYELLTGDLPYKSATAVGTLLKRITDRPENPSDIDAAIPPQLSAIVMKCLIADLEARYQTALAIVDDLDAWLSPRPKHSEIWKWSSAGLATLLLASGGLVYWRFSSLQPTQAHKTVTMLVADFNNATADPVFSGTLEPTFTIAMEGAKFIGTYDPLQARRIAAQMRPGAGKLDESVARLVAVREGINVVVGGNISREGNGYRIELKAVDPVSGKTIVARSAQASNQQGVLNAVGKLAVTIRKSLGDDTPVSAQLAAAETFTAASLEAAQKYGVGQQAFWQGKYDESLRTLSEAVQLDPTMGRAYSTMAVIHANMGRRAEAEKYFKLAMSRIDRMTDREKFRTRGSYYLAVRNVPKAVEEFGALLKQYPADTGGLANLALSYFYGRDMTRALEEGRRAVKLYPGNPLYRNNLAFYALYAGQFDAAVREAREALKISPGYLKGHIVIGLAELAQGHSDAAAESYHAIEKVSARGASMAAGGLADLAMYEGRLADAEPILNGAISAEIANKTPGLAARKLATLGELLLDRSHTAAAVSTAGRAALSAKDEAVLFEAAHVDIEAGQDAKAQALSSQLSGRLEPDPQAYAFLIQAGLKLKRGDAPEAIRLIREAQKRADTWLGRFELGQAYLAANAFTEAYSEFEACLKRRGEATAVFLDDVPSYRYLPPVYYYMGRAQEGLGSPAAAESYRTFLKIKAHSENDPLIKDARRRLATE